MIPAIPIRLLRKGNSSPLKVEENTIVPLADLCEGRIGVIDFWHTKCTRCPAAIEKLNDIAKKFDDKDVLWLTCALSQGEGNCGVVHDLVQEDSWSDLNHLFVDEQDKEHFKAIFGYSSVPFYALFDHNGRICQTGEPKSIDLLAELKILLEVKKGRNMETSQNGLTFDDDF